VKITAYLLLVPRLRISGAILRICLHAFMAWTGTTVIYFYVSQKQAFLPITNNKTHFVNSVFIKTILQSIQK
jgi:hypothetical protein